MNYRLKKSRSIAFRVTEAEYASIRNAAADAADIPNSWCRHVALRYARPGEISTSESPNVDASTPQSSTRARPNSLSIPKNRHATVTVTVSPCGTTNVQVETL
jgi:hypothetical protein